MDRDQFSVLLHDALTNIHDYAALEKHSLNEIVPRPDPASHKLGSLRSFIWEGIGLLKPPDTSPADSLEWRYYRILSGRYIEGLSIYELQKSLALGERQERRLHGRAVSALEDVLWDKLQPASAPGQAALPQAKRDTEAENGENGGAFPVSIEPLPLERILDEAGALLRPHFQALGSSLVLHAAVNLPLVLADRILLRQILLQLLNRISKAWARGDVEVEARPNAGRVVVEIAACVHPAQLPDRGILLADRLFAAWVERLDAGLEVKFLPPDACAGEPGALSRAILSLDLPLAYQSKILVVDDHEQAIRIVQRVLSQTGLQVNGVSEPTQVLAETRALHPKAILLDVMMPGVDGWEILQQLKADPETHPIPVVICSVWDQPDLAFSLGADAFLKKPIIPEQLLGELTRLGLMDS